MNKIYRVEESTDTEKAPLLTTVLEENSEQLVNSWDYFAYLLHAFMLETGFKLRNESHRKPDCYSFQYELANQESSDLAHCSVNIHRIGPIMTIIGNFHGLEERVSFVSSTIKIGDIVCDQRYTNLRSVSKEFKDKIALPLLVKMQEHHGLVPFNILQFPVEILVQIAEKLSDAKTIKSFIESCQRFRQVSEHPLLWKTLFSRHFPLKYKAAVEDQQSEPNWHQLFKAAQREEMSKKRQADGRTFQGLDFEWPDFELIEPPFSWIHFFSI